MFYTEINTAEEVIWIGAHDGNGALFAFSEIFTFLFEEGRENTTIVEFACDQTLMFGFWQENI